MSTRRDFLRTLGLGVAPLAAGTWARAAEPRLNFVFVLVDDLGWRDLGCFGSTFYETPNIDALCGSGMKFTDAYAACPVCSPTRASIMTGKYPARLDLTDFIAGARKGKLLPAEYLHHMPLEETTLPEALGEAGYTTFFAGKWHLGPESYWPENQGFDVNKGGWSRGGPYGGGKYFSPYGNPRLEDGPPGEHLPDRLATETVNFVRQCGDKPFLAYLSFYSVHTPLMSRPDLKAKYEQKATTVAHEGERWGIEGAREVRLLQDHAVYGGMVEAVDHAVAKVVAGLRQAGVADRTAIVFMSDNGGLSTSEGHPTSNLPLRAGKGWLYEGGIREPMFVVWPGVTRPGSVCDVPVISTDFYPTMLEMAGLAPRPEQHVDGVSIAPLLKQAAPPKRDALFWHYPHYGNQGGSPGGAVRRGDWKLIEFFEDDRLELYDLKDDLSEKTDLAAKMPAKADELRTLLHDWRKAVDANMPRPNPDYDPSSAPRPFTKGARDAEFDMLQLAAVDASELGCALRTRPRHVGFALKKLKEPIAGRAIFTLKLRTMVEEDEQGRFRNGFLVFGDRPDVAELVQCGLYLGGQRLYSIRQPASAGGAETAEALTAATNQVFDLVVTYDPATRKVTMTVDGKTVEAELTQPLGPIAYVGYSASNTVTAFSEVRVSGS